jgi:predicted NAD-dependent protein-ADP-ribosyltransferase YbiA (DUF1768 family)
MIVVYKFDQYNVDIDTSDPEYFWGANANNGEYSHWNQNYPFSRDGILFANGEQAMMVDKANVFMDFNKRQENMNTKNTKKIQDLGRQVANYNNDI